LHRLRKPGENVALHLVAIGFVQHFVTGAGVVVRLDASQARARCSAPARLLLTAEFTTSLIDTLLVDLQLPDRTHRAFAKPGLVLSW